MSSEGCGERVVTEGRGGWSPAYVILIGGVVIVLIVLVSRMVPGRAPAGREFAVPWELAQVSDGGTKLVLRAIHAPCDEVGEVSVSESDVAVAATIAGYRPLRECQTEVKYSYYEVLLEAPLDSRSLSGCELDGDCRTVAP